MLLCIPSSAERSGHSVLWPTGIFVDTTGPDRVPEVPLRGFVIQTLLRAVENGAMNEERRLNLQPQARKVVNSS
jgi:hypothetical protein